MLKQAIATLLALYAAAAFAAVDVNKASLAELEAVRGIGPAAAAKILDERRKGPFKDWPDIMQRVRGIKEARAARLSEAGLTVNGQAFHGAGGGAAKAPRAGKAAPAGKAAQAGNAAVGGAAGDASASESALARK